MVDVAPYEAGRWYNLLLYLSPGKGRFDLTVEDDHANPTVQKDLALGAEIRPVFAWNTTTGARVAMLCMMQSMPGKRLAEACLPAQLRWAGMICVARSRRLT